MFYFNKEVVLNNKILFLEKLLELFSLTLFHLLVN